MISIIKEEKPDKDWNKRLLKSGLGTIYQSEERGLFLEKQNVPNYFIKFLNNSGEIVGQLLVSLRTRYDSKELKSRILKHTPIIPKISCEWSYGPIVFDPKLLPEIYSTLENFLKTQKFYVKGWTHPMANTNPTNLSKPFIIRPWGTFVIDLSKSKDQIYSNIAKHSGRKNIERSIKRGVKIEEINESTLLEYYDLISVTKNESSRVASDFKFLERRWKMFKPLGFSGFLARYNDKPIGGLLFTYMNGYIIEIGVARSQFDTKNHLYSQDLLKWNLIKWGLENNMKYYDLTGYNPHPHSKKEEGINHYKKKWGGKPINYTRILMKPSIF